MADEYTVDTAFAELRQMFPRGLITIEVNQHDDDGGEREVKGGKGE
jgi:hypothetical protein